MFGTKKKKQSQLSVRPYTLHQLDRDRLIELTYAEDIPKEEQEAVSIYEKMLSNLPIYDEESRQCFGETVITDADKKERVLQSYEDKRLYRKQLCAKALMKRGFYKKVATADTECASDLMLATQSHFATKWWDACPHPNVYPEAGSHRNTMTYDIIQRFDEYFLRMPMSYIPLVGDPIYVTELV